MIEDHVQNLVGIKCLKRKQLLELSLCLAVRKFIFQVLHCDSSCCYNLFNFVFFGLFDQKSHALHQIPLWSPLEEMTEFLGVVERLGRGGGGVRGGSEKVVKRKGDEEYWDRT